MSWTEGKLIYVLQVFKVDGSKEVSIEKGKKIRLWVRVKDNLELLEIRASNQNSAEQIALEKGYLTVGLQRILPVVN